MTEILKEDFEDAINGGANNPTAQWDFIEMANNNELIIIDGKSKFLANVVEHNKPHYTEVLCGYKDVACYLHVYETTALQLIKNLKPNVLKMMNELFNCDPVVEKADFDRKMETYSRANGYNEKEASLYLGITVDSFSKIKSKIIYSDTDYYLQDILQGFRGLFLPKFTTYGTNTSLVKDFVKGFNSKFGIQLEIQYCDICHDHVAVDQCYNSKCQSDSEPNFVCPAHFVMIDVKEWDIRKRPKVLCSECNSNPEYNSYKRL